VQHPSLIDQSLLTLANHLTSGIAVLDCDFRYLFINPILADFNGHSVEQHIGRSVREVLPELADCILPLLTQVRDSAIPLLDFNLSPVSAGKTAIGHWTGSYIPVLSDDQQVVAIAVVATNQTREKQLQQSQQQDLIRLKQVLNNMFAFVGLLAPDGTLLDANAPPLDMAGISLDEVVGKKFWQCFWWSHSISDAEQIELACMRAANGVTSRFDVQARMKDSIIIIDFMIAPVFDESGQLQYLVPSGIDITRRKRSEQALQDSENRFRQVFNSAADALIAVNTEGVITLANLRAEQMFGYTLLELIGASIDQLVPTSVRNSHQHHRMSFMAKPSSRPMAQRQELFAQRKDGSLFPVEIGLTYLGKDPKAAVVATVTDVTLAVQAKQHMQLIIDEKSALLDERELLLQEIHHRVKNNLQIVSSLLNLRSNNANSEVKELMNDSQLRVRTMALTHQLLYEHKNFSQIPFGSYLRQLCLLIRQSSRTTDYIQFELNHIDEQIQLPLDQAIPCGLLVTEIITNSIKHAFSEGHAGLIYIELRPEGDQVKLTVGDNGTIKTDFQLGQGSSLGMQLIPAFLAQMGANVQLDKDSGTHYRVSFQIRSGSHTQ